MHSIISIESKDWNYGLGNTLERGGIGIGDMTGIAMCTFCHLEISFLSFCGVFLVYQSREKQLKGRMNDGVHMYLVRIMCSIFKRYPDGNKDQRHSRVKINWNFIYPKSSWKCGITKFRHNKETFNSMKTFTSHTLIMTGREVDGEREKEKDREGWGWRYLFTYFLIGSCCRCHHT